MDINVKNDETHSVNGGRSHYVRKNELHRVEANQTQAVKGATEILTGKGKLDAAVEQYVIASGTKLRLVSGESAIELNANGKINLIGKEFNVFVEGEGYITTGGKIHLNVSGTQPGTTAPGAGHKSDIEEAVKEKFMPGKGSKVTLESLSSHLLGPVATSASSSLQSQNEDKFQKITPFILQNEGGYINDPKDSGRATNKGIAWETWRKYAKEDLGIEPTLDNLKNITTAQAEVIYYKRYWEPSGFNNLKDLKLALIAYDWTITSDGAGKQIQNLLNDEFGQQLVIDGKIGPKTIEAMNSITDSAKLTEKIAGVRKKYYADLVLKKPQTVKVLKGWLSRVDRCLRWHYNGQ